MVEVSPHPISQASGIMCALQIQLCRHRADNPAAHTGADSSNTVPDKLCLQLRLIVAGDCELHTLSHHLSVIGLLHLSALLTEKEDDSPLALLAVYICHMRHLDGRAHNQPDWALVRHHPNRAHQQTLAMKQWEAQAHCLEEIPAMKSQTCGPDRH